ncbi:hypothetical protein F2Q70_00030675 [Brassica cretica]|uniref:Uncharacterized protein n=1 Tax=Brassica cretica TaxID=69181 RepID=A0A8S9FPZ0_BRACR|nr:hypothetical protein F2Q70_00030675 [Brassica cretica]
MDWSCSNSNSGTLICQAAGLFFFVIPKLPHTRRIGSFTFLRCFSPPSHLPLLLHIPFVLSISIAQKSKLYRSSTYILGQGMVQREDNAEDMRFYGGDRRFGRGKGGATSRSNGGSNTILNPFSSHSIQSRLRRRCREVQFILIQILGYVYPTMVISKMTPEELSMLPSVSQM